MSQTYEERLVQGLEKLGWARDLGDKSKYKAYTHPQQTIKLFVGATGALRSDDCASRSHSIGCPGMFQSAFYKQVLAAGTEPTKKSTFVEF